ncbi:hypothetical protein H8E07_18800 [bacterium]|nr:hypothetical protein [bacterium]
MIASAKDRLHRHGMTACTLLLLFALLGLDAAHFNHHYAEAAAHADGDADHHHDGWECAVFHSGLLTEASFVASVPEAPVARLTPPRPRRHAAEPDVDAHAPRAPPHAS